MKPTLWGLTAFFNPQRYRGRKRLYDIFRDMTKRQGLRLLAVELAFRDAPFELREGDADILIGIRAGDEGVMWQKERLLNVGLGLLPPECDAVVWLDCDVIFENPQWISETTELLCRYPVVQPFSISVRLPYGQTAVNIQTANRPIHDRKPSSGYTYTYSQATPLVDYMLTGHTGFAWAARRSLFDGIGMYDRMIAGGGDTVLACGFFGRPSHRFTHLLSDALVDDQRRWIQAMSERVAGAVTFTRGGLFHLWHGSQPSRRTFSRLEALTEYSFDPRRDIAVNSDGCFEWTGNKPGLRKKMTRYFWLRNEDDSRVREGLRRVEAGLRSWRKQWYPGIQTSLAKAAGRLELVAGSSFRTLKDSKLTLIIMNWKRPEMVSRLVKAYSGYDIIGDIVVWNNNSGNLPELEPGGRVKTITCRFDAGLDSRWAAGALADHPHLLIHDDDVLLSEAGLMLLFSKYLRRPHLIHGLRGRDCEQGYNRTDSFGKVDVVLTTCLVINKKYIDAYFKTVSLFDDLRNYGCGNGEDIVMSYVVRKATGEKGRAYGIPFTDFDRDLAEHSISRRPGHMSVRNEIVRRCAERLTGKRADFKIEDYGLDSLNRIFPPSWLRYVEDPETIAKPQNFILSENVSEEKFAAALSLLCRTPVFAQRGISAGD